MINFSLKLIIVLFHVKEKSPSEIICDSVVTNIVLSLQKLPKADFHIVQDAGHSTKEEGIQSQLIAATEKYKKL